MMSVLGPLSIDPNMLNAQKQQVQVRGVQDWGGRLGLSWEPSECAELLFQSPELSPNCCE